MLRTYKDLKVWQRAYDLCLLVYRVSACFPVEERFGLIAQMRRAAVSIPSNIAEGYSRATTKDYVRFLWIAAGSLAELETQSLLAKDLRLGADVGLGSVLESVAELQRMLPALIRSLKREFVPSGSSPRC